MSTVKQQTVVNEKSLLPTACKPLNVEKKLSQIPYVGEGGVGGVRVVFWKLAL